MSTTMMVTSEEGGTLILEGTTLEVPPGALPADTEITIESTTAAPPSSFGSWSSPVYQFGPDGLVFQVPVQVTLTFGGSPVEPAVFWSTTDGGFENRGGTVTGDHITASVLHFSQGFVATPPPGSPPPPDAGTHPIGDAGADGGPHPTGDGGTGSGGGSGDGGTGSGGGGPDGGIQPTVDGGTLPTGDGGTLPTGDGGTGSGGGDGGTGSGGGGGDGGIPPTGDGGTGGGGGPDGGTQPAGDGGTQPIGDAGTGSGGGGGGGSIDAGGPPPKDP
jgi:hypothetical protein